MCVCIYILDLNPCNAQNMFNLFSICLRSCGAIINIVRGKRSKHDQSKKKNYRGVIVYKIES